MTAPQLVAGEAVRRVVALELSGERRKLALLIAALEDAGMPAAPPLRDLARRLGRPEKQVRRDCERLAVDGVLVPTRRGRGQKRPARFRLTLPTENRDPSGWHVDGGRWPREAVAAHVGYTDSSGAMTP